MHQHLEQPYKLEFATDERRRRQAMSRLQHSFVQAGLLLMPWMSRLLQLPTELQLLNSKHGLRSKGNNDRWVYRRRPGLIVQQAARLAGTWCTVPLPAVALAESLFQAMQSGWGSGGDCTSPRLVLLQPPHTETLCTAAHLHSLP